MAGRLQKAVNPYLEKVLTRPGLIIPFSNKGISVSERGFIKTMLSLYRNVYLELCSGSGGHLIERARCNPDSLFIGFELRYKRIFRTAEKAEREGLKNIILLRTDAADAADYVGRDLVSGVYINFPDPWAKKRWRKHRLLSADFLKKLANLLKTGSFFSFKTDHKEYFSEVVETLKYLKMYELERIISDLHSGEGDWKTIKSEFERLFISKGRPVYYLIARKK